MSYGLNFGWEGPIGFRLGGPIGQYMGFWGGPIKAYITNLVQGSYELLSKLNSLKEVILWVI